MSDTAITIMEHTIMFEVFEAPFMQRALLAGIFIGILAGYYGAFVVQRGLSFLGDGLAHAAFGGAALGLLLNREPLVIAVPFTIVVALAITWTKNRTALGHDTAIGIFKALAMALGIIFLSLRKEYSADAMAYLFGSILGVTQSDLWIVAAVFVAACAMIPLWRAWAYATFDRELAVADRVPAARHDYILFILIAVTVVVAVKIVGAVLATSCLVIPAAAARLLSRRFAVMTIAAALLGAITVFGGLVLSYHLDLPSGAAIVILQTAVFGLAALFPRQS